MARYFLAVNQLPKLIPLMEYSSQNTGRKEKNWDTGGGKCVAFLCGSGAAGSTEQIISAVLLNLNIVGQPGDKKKPQGFLLSCLGRSGRPTVSLQGPSVGTGIQWSSSAFKTSFDLSCEIIGLLQLDGPRIEDIKRYYLSLQMCFIYF